MKEKPSGIPCNGGSGVTMEPKDLMNLFNFGSNVWDYKNNNRVENEIERLLLMLTFSFLVSPQNQSTAQAPVRPVGNN